MFTCVSIWLITPSLGVALVFVTGTTKSERLHDFD